MKNILIKISKIVNKLILYIMKMIVLFFFVFILGVFVGNVNF